MRKSLILGLLGIFVMSVSVGSAQVPAGPVRSPLVRPRAPLSPDTTVDAVTGRAGQGAQSLISGKAVDENMRPLPDVSLRLRNLETNQIEQVTRANSIGEFTFVAQPQIPYVVEIADQAGAVVAVGDIITAQAGDVAGAIVALPSRLPVLGGVFGETTGSVMSAATSTGLTVVEVSVAPLVSPER